MKAWDVADKHRIQSFAAMITKALGEVSVNAFLNLHVLLSRLKSFIYENHSMVHFSRYLIDEHDFPGYWNENFQAAWDIPQILCPQASRPPCKNGHFWRGSGLSNIFFNFGDTAMLQNMKNIKIKFGIDLWYFSQQLVNTSDLIENEIWWFCKNVPRQKMKILKS